MYQCNCFVTVYTRVHRVGAVDTRSINTLNSEYIATIGNTLTLSLVPEIGAVFTNESEIPFMGRPGANGPLKTRGLELLALDR